MHTLPFSSLRFVRYTVRLCVLGLLLTGMLFAGCTSLRCPAYASAFILDDSLRRATFSLFGPDSLPLPAPKVEKDKNNLIVRVTDRNILRRMYTIRARKIYPPQPTEEAAVDEVENDSLFTDEGISDLSVSLPLDEEDVDTTNTFLSVSLPLDGEDVDTTHTLVTEPQDVVADTNTSTNGPIAYLYGYDPADNFNVEQVFYNEQFGHLFVAQQEEAKEEALIEEILQTEFDVVPEAYIEGSFVDEWEEEEDEAEEDEDEEDEETDNLNNEH